MGGTGVEVGVAGTGLAVAGIGLAVAGTGLARGRGSVGVAVGSASWLEHPIIRNVERPTANHNLCLVITNASVDQW